MQVIYQKSNAYGNLQKPFRNPFDLWCTQDPFCPNLRHESPPEGCFFLSTGLIFELVRDIRLNNLYVKFQNEILKSFALSHAQDPFCPISNNKSPPEDYLRAYRPNFQTRLRYSTKYPVYQISKSNSKNILT